MAFGRTVKSLGVASSELSLPVPRVGAVRTTTVDEPVQRACRTRVRVGALRPHCRRREPLLVPVATARSTVAAHNAVIIWSPVLGVADVAAGAV